MRHRRVPLTIAALSFSAALSLQTVSALARPHDRPLPAGKHDVTWDGHTANGQAAPAGVYLYRIETPHGVASGKIVLIQGR